MRGKVIAMVGGVYKVQTDSAHCHSVKPLGVLKHRKIQIVVGDDAEIDLSDSTLTDIYPRKNLLIRPRIANIDLGIVVISADKPQFSSYLLDKFLTLLNFSGIRPLVVLSKSDLTDEKTIGRIVGQYRKMEIEVLPYSRSDEAAFAEILRRIKGKTAAFMGQSGVGKSSLINRIDSGFSRAVGEYSQSLGRGKHQTKEVVLLPYRNGFIGDTPGFSSLELPFYKEDLARFSPCADRFYLSCRYDDCLHRNEPDCKVRESVFQGETDEENYRNYLTLSDELPSRKDRYQ